MPELDVATPYAVSVRAVAVNPVGIHPTGNVAILVPVPGGPGQPGPPGDGAQICGETPAGAVNGVNTTFTVDSNYQAASTRVYLNGLRETFYTESGAAEITFDDPPQSGDTITIDYTLD
jgi:hypothetical protein